MSEKKEFIKQEINEFCKLNNLNTTVIYEYYILSNLNIKDLKEIKNIFERNAVYELLTIYTNDLINSDLIQILFDSIKTCYKSNQKEKGFFVEKKFLEKFKKIFYIQNCENNEDFFYQKISFIISRRLFYIHNGDLEYPQINKLELSLLLEQITSDFILYLTTIQIYNKILVDFNENHIKSYVLRILKKISKKTEKIKFNLLKINNKTVYFIESSYNIKLFFHFYAKILLCEPSLIHWKNLCLNGGFHFLNKKKIIESNKYNTYLNFKENILNFVKNQNEISFFIDNKMIEKQHEYVLKQIIKDNDMNKEWGDYFKEITDISEKELNETLSLENYKIKMKKNYYIKKINNLEELNKVNEKLNKKIKKKSMENKLINKKKYLENLIEKKIYFFDPKMQNKWLQKNFSYIFILKIYLEYIDFFKNYKESLFFSIFFDFRGRFYYNSAVAPDKGWPFRFLYHFDEEIHENSSDNLIDINLYSQEIFKVEEKIGNLTEFQKKSLLWVLMSIGAVTIKKKSVITEKEFILEGLNNYFNEKKVEDNLENSELIYYYLIIDNYNNDKKNRYLIKDISGSIFQNGSIILGIKNENSLKILNLDNDAWHDPYAPLIEKINENVKDSLKIFFNRKTLKKSIMTKYYNATFIKSFHYFIKEVEKDNNYTEALYKDLLLEFVKIFKILKNLEKEIIFQNSSEDYNNFLKKNNINFITFDEFSFSLFSYKIESKRLDIVVDGERLTSTIYKISKKINKKKMENSMIPNVFHGEDANRARIVINSLKTNCFTIHDAFGISHLKANQLILKANEKFDINVKKPFYLNNNKVDKKIFSKFIIL